MRVVVICMIGFSILGCERGSKSASVTADTVAHTPAQDTVAVAMAQYGEAMFDTVKFASDAEALSRGADVYAWACASCHGPKGKGDGRFVLNGDTLHPPSFLEPDWRFAKDEPGLRKRIFVGNTRGMPHWGLRQMQPRDIVAVQKYIVQKLRSGE